MVGKNFVIACLMGSWLLSVLTKTASLVSPEHIRDLSAQSSSSFQIFCLWLSRHFSFWGKYLTYCSVRKKCDTFLNTMLCCTHVFSWVWPLVTPWTVACQAPLSMGFSRQEYESGLPFPSSWDIPSPGIEPTYPAWQADSLPLSHVGTPREDRGSFKFLVISLIWVVCLRKPLALSIPTHGLFRQSAQHKLRGSAVGSRHSLTL